MGKMDLSLFAYRLNLQLLLIFINQAKAHVAVGDYRVAITTNIHMNGMARRLDGNMSSSVGGSRETWRVSAREAPPSVASV
jgi:hypothetical protein